MAFQIYRPFVFKACKNFLSTSHCLSKFGSDYSRREWATLMLARLTADERRSLQEGLSKYSTDSPAPTKILCAPLTRSQKRLIALAHGLPFVGFGFIDNAVMILAGEYIDLSLASAFGFSTMAAAGLGNLVSDLAGMGLVGYMELFYSKFGYKSPDLTPEQMDSTSARLSSTFGRIAGITVGCLLGMLPLLLFDSKPSRESKDS